jgi:hypothetical protein
MKEGYLIKFCMKLIAEISHNKYYSQFYHLTCELVRLPLIRQFFLIPNLSDEFANYFQYILINRFPELLFHLKL